MIVTSVRYARSFFLAVLAPTFTSIITITPLPLPLWLLFLLYFPTLPPPLLFLLFTCWPQEVFLSILDVEQTTGAYRAPGSPGHSCSLETADATPSFDAASTPMTPEAGSGAQPVTCAGHEGGPPSASLSYQLALSIQKTFWSLFAESFTTIGCVPIGGSAQTLTLIGWTFVCLAFIVPKIIDHNGNTSDAPALLEPAAFYDASRPPGYPLYYDTQLQLQSIKKQV